MSLNNSFQSVGNKPPVIDPFVRIFLADILSPIALYAEYAGNEEWSLASDALLKICQLTQKLFVERGNMSYLDLPSYEILASELASVVELITTTPINCSEFDEKQTKWIARATKNIRDRYKDVVLASEVTFQPN